MPWSFQLLLPRTAAAAPALKALTNAIVRAAPPAIKSTNRSVLLVFNTRF